MQRWLVGHGAVPGSRRRRVRAHVGPGRLARAFPTWFDTSFFAAAIRRGDARRARELTPV